MTRALLLTLLLFAFAGAARANTPPPEPRPAALAATRVFVAELPIEEFSFFPVTERVADELADTWLRYRPGLPEGVAPATVRAILAQRLMMETAQSVPRLVAEVEESYAAILAMRFSPAQIQAMRAFYAGPDGRAFALDRVIDSSQLEAIVADAVRRAVEPRVERLAAESVDSARRLGQLNR